MKKHDKKVGMVHQWVSVIVFGVASFITSLMTPVIIIGAILWCIC